MQKTTFLCPTNTYILYKYIHKYILHTTAINLKRGDIQSKRGGGAGGGRSVFFSLCCKMVRPSYVVSHMTRMWSCGALASLPVSLSSSHLAVISVGPVGGAAVARLVDLALLLQAAGLATLAGTALNEHTHTHT